MSAFNQVSVFFCQNASDGQCHTLLHEIYAHVNASTLNMITCPIV